MKDNLTYAGAEGILCSRLASASGISKARVGQIAWAHGLGKSTKGAQRPLSQRQAQILAFIRGFAADNLVSTDRSRGR